MKDDEILQVRRLSREIIHRIGRLHGNFPECELPLGEARLLFEIGEDGATVRDLRALLTLDSGYVSRMLRSLEARGLVISRRDAADARIQRTVLTTHGKKLWRVLDQQIGDKAASLLRPLGAPQRMRLLIAMAEVERYMRASSVIIEPADPSSNDARACLRAYFDELRERFEEGFDPSNTVSANPEELRPPYGWFFIARLDQNSVGCGAIKIMDSSYGEIKRMWVAPFARGLGIAQRLLQTLEACAVAAGVDVLRLDSNRSLTEARNLYLRNGFFEIAPYNTNPYAHHWFEKRGLK